MLSYCLDGRESIMFSQFNSLTKALVNVLLRVHQQLPAIQKVNKKNMWTLTNLQVYLDRSLISDS